MNNGHNFNFSLKSYSELIGVLTKLDLSNRSKLLYSDNEVLKEYNVTIEQINDLRYHLDDL